MMEILAGGFYLFLLVWLIILIYLYKTAIQSMKGKTIAMALAMSVGISFGTFAAIGYPASFFEVTIISMLVGVVTGVIAGLPFSLVAVIEGVLSGIMSGMMGTMLGYMILPDNQNQLIHIVGILAAGIFFLLFLFIAADMNRIKSKWLHPLPFFLVVVLFIISFDSYTFSASKQQESQHALHNNNLEQVIQISDDSFQYAPKQIHAKAAKVITFTLVNDSDEEHDFVIKELDYHLHAMPRSKSKKTVIFPQAGLYEVYCSLPGHKEAGMTAMIQVGE